MQKEKQYKILLKQITSVLNQTNDEISKMATISCLLSQSILYFYWCGFYRVTHDRHLTIGPYQGTLACIDIPFNKGVCGKSATLKETIIVPDTHKFLDHIACDSRSNSEIVVPVFNSKKELIAVFDADSTEFNSFCAIDKLFLEEVMSLFQNES